MRNGRLERGCGFKRHPNFGMIHEHPRVLLYHGKEWASACKNEDGPKADDEESAPGSADFGVSIRDTVLKVCESDGS